MRLVAPQSLGADPHACRSICERVVNPPDQRHRAVIEVLDDVEVPQRVSAIQSLSHQPADQLLELVSSDSTAGVERRDMPRNVELRIVEPNRPGNTKRRFD
jgi:hypothetical protein